MFLDDLREPLPFREWLEVVVSNCPNPNSDVVSLSSPPSERTTMHKSLGAYGNHFRVFSVEMNMKTCDSSIVATFTHPCRVGAQDSNPVIENVEYVGYLEEITQLNYQQLSVVVFLCRWVQANYCG